DWWWIFLANIPFGLIAFALAGALPDAAPTPRPFDWLSAILNALVLGLLVTGLGILARAPPWGGLALAVGVGLGAVLVRRELKQSVPLVPLDLLRIRPFAVAVSSSICCFAAQTCAFIALPFYLQDSLSLGKLETGLILTAWPAAVALSAPAAGRIA